ncbi:hypothetical protein CBS101457_003171 [Exobasidium rhododendri]|nr:hypothetical protein CBS101457_003171 [Exobasidium rhododendri]
MTRYTKLDRRRPEFVKDRLPGGADRSSSPEAEASTSAVAAIATRATDDVDKEEVTSSREVPASVTTKDGNATKPEPSEPAKLLKRAKLLRLKAKKAKDDTRKQELLRQVQELERKVNTLNGERGRGKIGTAANKAHKEGKRSTNRSDEAEHSAAGPVNPWKVMEAERRKVSDVRSEVRREKREQERLSTTRCFACRQMGHSAKDCPVSLNEPTEETDDQSIPSGVVCCYRCGSTEHSLAKCKRSAPHVGPDLPFASCFICKEKGHLASKCKQNKGRGIYPNGGSCMLCQSVDHLAKDCELRTNAAGVNSISNAAISMGNTYSKTGADEDDFHSLSRKRREIEEEEKSAGAKKRKTVEKKVVSF